MKMIESWRRWRSYRADYRSWRDVQSLRDAGARTAEYVTGLRPSFPDHGFAAHSGPDPETAEIAGDLAMLNLAGAMTWSSQPAFWSADPAQLHDATACAQRAAVEMFAPVELGERLIRRAVDAGLLVSATLVSGLGRTRSGQSIPVTVYTRDEVTDTVEAVDILGPDEGVNWQVQTEFGAHARRDLTFLFGALGDGAVRDIERSTVLTVVDPRWGRQRLLWDTLTGALR